MQNFSAAAEQLAQSQQSIDNIIDQTEGIYSFYYFLSSSSSSSSSVFSNEDAELPSSSSSSSASMSMAGLGQCPSTPETDAKSIYIGNVDYEVGPEEIANFFSSCGAVERVTILTNRKDHPKGAAYLEFKNKESVQEALKLDKQEFHGRLLTVFFVIQFICSVILQLMSCVRNS